MEERVIQVFCDICSRGVLVWRESMYKCPKCGKQVCHTCFHPPHKMCVECSRPQREADEMSRLVARQAAEEQEREAAKLRASNRLWMGILTAVAIVAAASIMTYFLLSANLQLRVPDIVPKKAAPAETP
jgi:hypothetical protein